MYFRKSGFTSLEVLAKSKAHPSGALFLTGFTLVEVLVASVIGAFIALVAVGSLKAISTSAETVDNSIYAAAEVRFASNMIARDLMNLYRDKNADSMRLIGGVEESGGDAGSWLTLYTVGRVKARIDQPEGDVYEVQYYLSKGEEKSVLMRRLWPNPDKEAEPGGMLTVIAEDVDVFEVRFFDGKEWFSEWPEEMRTIAELVEVSIAAKLARQTTVGTEAATETFVVNFARPIWREGGEDSKEEEQ